MLGFDKEPEIEKTDQVFFSFWSEFFSFWSEFFSFWPKFLFLLINFFSFLIRNFFPFDQNFFLFDQFFLENHTQILTKIHQGSSADYRNGKSDLLADGVSTFEICFLKKKFLSWKMPFEFWFHFFFLNRGVWENFISLRAMVRNLHHAVVGHCVRFVLCLCFLLGVEAAITHSLLLGNVEAAVEMCLAHGRDAEALFLSLSGCGSALPALYHKARDQYFASHGSSLSALIHGIVKNDAQFLLKNCDVVDWREMIILLANYFPHDHFKLLIGTFIAFILLFCIFIFMLF